MIPADKLAEVVGCEKPDVARGSPEALAFECFGLTLDEKGCSLVDILAYADEELIENRREFMFLVKEAESEHWKIQNEKRKNRENKIVRE